MAYTSERSAIQERSTGLGERLLGALCAGVGTLVLIVLLTGVYLTVLNPSVTTLPASVAYVNSGVGLLTVIGPVWWWLDADKRRAAFPLRIPIKANQHSEDDPHSPSIIRSVSRLYWGIHHR